MHKSNECVCTDTNAMLSEMRNVIRDCINTNADQVLSYCLNAFTTENVVPNALHRSLSPHTGIGVYCRVQTAVSRSTVPRKILLCERNFQLHSRQLACQVCAMFTLARSIKLHFNCTNQHRRWEKSERERESHTVSICVLHGEIVKSYKIERGVE